MLFVPGKGVTRCEGMCGCSGIQSESNPRSSTARANAGTGIDLSVKNVETPYRIRSWPSFEMAAAGLRQT